MTTERESLPPVHEPPPRVLPPEPVTSSLTGPDHSAAPLTSAATPDGRNEEPPRYHPSVPPATASVLPPASETPATPGGDFPDNLNAGPPVYQPSTPPANMDRQAPT